MKNNSIVNRLIRKAKSIFTPKSEKPEIKKREPELIIPERHYSKSYHEPPCSGIKKDLARKRRAKIRQQKESRIINREY